MTGVGLYSALTSHFAMNIEAEDRSHTLPLPASVATPRNRITTQLSAWLTPGRLFWLVMLLGAALRIYRYNALGLWIDEGYTVMFARMSWADVLGLHGAYDPSPPSILCWRKLRLCSHRS